MYIFTDPHLFIELTQILVYVQMYYKWSGLVYEYFAFENML